MWTPKRILIMIAGTFLFLAGFAVYDYFLGGYDGLPPLPEEYAFDPNRPAMLSGVIEDSKTDEKMKTAFGPNSEEAKLPFILNIDSRKMLLAAKQFDIEDDGRVKLSPFSAALFPKKGGDPGAYPEVNTIQCEVAYLTLDQPAKNFMDLTSRRIIGVELRGTGPRGVTIINNRRTPAKNDDIEVNITLAPVYYDERTNKIWTEGFVHLLDTASQPNPTEINAKGMEMQLAKETTPLRPKNAPAPKKGEGIGGVEHLILKSHVVMHLYMDARNGFLAGGQESAKPAPAAGTAEKAHVMVKTNGSMHYDLTKEQAQFDSPAPPPDAALGSAEPVLVTREHRLSANDRKFDQLTCDSLLLTFRRKDAADKEPDAGPKDPLTGDKEIESALALARPGREVTLSMDTENMEAYCDELFYECATASAGARTRLKGAPLHAIRDGNVLDAQELHLFGPDKNGNGQHAFAKGPGKIDLLDKALDLGLQNNDAKGNDPKNMDPKDGEPKSNDKTRHTTHALFKDNLISTNDRDGDRVFDLLTLTGDAQFIDDEHQQSLCGQRLQVWFTPNNGPQENKQQADGAPRQKPHKVEAFERVTVQAPEMIIERCNHLIVVFKEMPASDAQLPNDVLPVPLTPGGARGNGAGANPMAPLSPMTPLAGAKPPMVQLQTPQPEVKAGLPDMKTPAAAAAPANPFLDMSGGGDPKKPRKPFRVSADDVVAFITTLGTKKQLQELVTEGNVHVQQEGETPKDKGIDITGHMLNLIYHPLGNRLLVYEDGRRPAQLQVGELTIIGPKIDIEQKDNTAAVDGVGAMRMPSKTSFDGATPAKEGAYVTIHWNKDMLFSGKFAEFHGGVQAFQDNSVLKCQSMQVTLDKFVSFKEGQKDKQDAKLEKLLCYKQVFAEEKTPTPEGKIQAWKRLFGTALDMDNPEGRFIVVGRGRVDNIAQGDTDPKLAGAAPGQPVPAQPVGAKAGPQNAKPGQQLKFTRVDFDGRMWGKNKQGGPKLAIFYDNVEVYHQPGADPDVQVNPNQPPKDGFYMRCNNLNVSTQERDGRSYKFMVAENNAFFRTPEFFGNADVIKYDESQELIIFEGKNGNLVKLYKLGAIGARPQLIEGRKILYNRKTGTFTLDGGKVISSWLRERERASDAAGVALNGKQNSFVARLDLDGQHEPFLGLGLTARHDRQILAADRAIFDLALFGRGDRQADAILLVGAV